MPLTCGTRLGPYEILSPIGAGGMGQVWKARDTRLDRTVAIKTVDAGIKRQHFHRFRSQTKPAIGQEAVPTLYEILNSPWPSTVGRTTIEHAPNGSGSWWTGPPLKRRAPHADVEAQEVWQVGRGIVPAHLAHRGPCERTSTARHTAHLAFDPPGDETTPVSHSSSSC
jgi:hypothetical protein